MALINSEQFGTTDSEDFVTIARRFINSVEGSFPKLIESKNAGADEEEIEEANKVLGFEMPKDLQKLYMLINGDNYEFGGLMLGLNFFACDEMAQEYKRLCRTIDESEPAGQNEKQHGEFFCAPEKYVKNVKFNKKWIPFAGDGSGLYLIIDLDPDENGFLGQIVTYGEDEPQRVAAASSLRHFLEFAARMTDEMAVDFLEDDGAQMRQKDNIHTIDWLNSQQTP